MLVLCGSALSQMWEVLKENKAFPLLDSGSKCAMANHLEAE